MSFAQQHPHFYCQNTGLFEEISNDKHREVKCRDPRCAVRCRDNWAKKKGMVLAYFLELLEHKSDYKVYRGCLHLPDNADDNAHRKARDTFMKSLRRLEHQTGWIAKIYAVMDITDNDNAHYDYVLYCSSSVPQKTLKRWIKQTWQQAGGSRNTCVLMTTAEEMFGTSNYVFKVPQRDRRQFVYLPVRGGLEMTWRSARFFNGSWLWDDATNEEGLWKELKLKWFGGDEHHPISISNKVSTEERQQVHLHWLQWYLPVVGVEDSGVTIDEIRRYFSWSGGWVCDLLAMLPNAHCEQGEWWRDGYCATPLPMFNEIDPDALDKIPAYDDQMQDVISLDHMMNNEHRPISISNKVSSEEEQPVTKSTTKTLENKAIAEEEVRIYQERIRTSMTGVTTPEQALEPQDIADMISSTVENTVKMLLSMPDAVRLNGWQDRQGFFWWNKYHLRT